MHTRWEGAKYCLVLLPNTAYALRHLYCAGKDLPPSIVRSAFQYAAEMRVPLCAFLGDTCVTLELTDELQVSGRCSIQMSSPSSELSCYLSMPMAGTP